MEEQDLFQNQNGGSIPTSPLKLCYQKIKRDSFLEDNKQDLFINWWKDIEQNKKSIIVKPIERNIAESFIKKYEWLGTLPVNYKYFYGSFSKSYLLAVCCFVEVKFGGRFTLFNENAICLGRGATIFYANKWISSFTVSKSCKLLMNGKEPCFVVAYSDWEAGEIGTIYQACNWIYLGHRKTKEWVDKNGNRFDINTPIVRAVSGFERRNNPELKATRQQIEEQKNIMIKDGFKLVDGPVRGRYAYVYGNKGKRYDYLMSILKQNSVKYPKRFEHEQFIMRKPVHLDNGQALADEKAKEGDAHGT